MTIREKLTKIQTELKAPKSQYNNFGKYKYRSLEDIMEALKPLMKEVGACLVVEDDIKMVGDRIYVIAKATLFNSEGDDSISAQAMARESAQKKGMDESQITGTASSYARKYCLNGLFAIDDTKDADSMITAKTTDLLRAKQQKMTRSAHGQSLNHAATVKA